MNVRQLTIRDGGQVRAGSFGEGAGGTLTVNASDSVEVSGTGTIGADQVNSTLFTQAQAAGDAGNLNITTGSLNVRDGGQVTVSSIGSGKAGDLQVQARDLSLDNRGALTATTTSGNGGDITLQVPDLLLLRHSSQISTTAGNQQNGGNGGNITINNPFIVAVSSENSDISANAFTGNGGQVTITTKGIFGTQFRQQPTLESDITASSTNGGINGTVQINTVDFNSSGVLTVLPANLVDVSRLIAQGCPADVGPRASKFVVTGRGGFPPNPSQPLSTDAVLTNWATLNPKVKNHSGSAHSSNSFSPAPTQIVEATGWVIGPKGEVILTATAPSPTRQIPWLTPTTCHGS